MSLDSQRWASEVLLQSKSIFWRYYKENMYHLLTCPCLDTGSPVPLGNLAYPRESREYCAFRGNENRKHFLLQMSLQLIQMIAKQLDNDNIPTTNHVTAYCHQLIISQRMQCPTALRPPAQQLAA